MDYRTEANEFIDIIDNRIGDYLKKSNILTEYIGKIRSIGLNQTAQVQLLGYNTVFTFPYVDDLHGKIKIGDSVKVRSKIGNLNTGVIELRYYGGNK